MLSDNDRQERLELARRLVEQLEAGSDSEAEATLERLAGQHDNQLFQEIGRLTRDLHEAINGFLLDGRIAELAEQEIPDASERLNYVITMTDKAANTSLNAVEKSLPLADELQRSAQRLAASWGRFQARELSVEEFRQLSRELAEFLELTNGHAVTLHQQLSEVLMAQDFQDLTGQIIGKVIKLIQDVESKLVQLVRISGTQRPEHKQNESSKLEGPVVPTVDHGDVVSGQDDVDDLLSSLGF